MHDNDNKQQISKKTKSKNKNSDKVIKVTQQRTNTEHQTLKRKMTRTQNHKIPSQPGWG